MLLHHPNLAHFAARVTHSPSTSSSVSPDGDRRRETRRPVLLSATIHPLQLGSRERVEATVIDISGHGMQLALRRPVKPGTEIQAILDGAFILGNVRYCVEKEGVFHAGIEVADVLIVPDRRSRR